MSDIAIEVKNLTKEFKIPHKKVDTVFERLASSLSGNRHSYERFLALDNVSFVVRRGESLGVIGRNGSGKSTLLKLIARIINPTSGTVTTNGSVMPFIELGVGFQYDITARENVFLYGAIMGLKQKEIEERYKELVEFSELENFMDMKLKDFSSGMVARLAFSTAIMADPDILLIDEVLAVGDIDFRKKCFEKMNEYKRKGKTIVLVSHDLNMIEEICSSSIFLENGRMLDIGKTEKVVNSYVEKLADKKEKELLKENTQQAQEAIKTDSTPTRWGTGEIAVSSAKLFDDKGNERYLFTKGEPAFVVIEYNSSIKDDKAFAWIQIRRLKDDILVYGCNTHACNVPGQGININVTAGENGRVKLELKAMDLAEGEYYLGAGFAQQNKIEANTKVYDFISKAFTFGIKKSTNQMPDVGVVHLKFSWTKL